ncbi:ig-like domain-containing protein [Caerostris extrusa]|uniref:Ig-like domain-containing protein n=1 Tax=Caerostris extrusa TaxID=172846 RepID=A0AAV4W2B7_CAEEX|nr:ig-like domain-containing protein [Caerostris extrusa]
MSPVVQKIHVGRPWVINCSVSGHPIHGVHWRKDVDVLSLDGRVSQISRDVIRIDPVQREDRGMYQCIAYNDQDTAQAAVELTLGGKAIGRLALNQEKLYINPMFKKQKGLFEFTSDLVLC